MAIERTFSIIKPDATERNLTGAVNALIEKAGLRIVAQKRIRMTREQAETFYAVHKARPFFGELVEFIISAPVVVQVLQGEGVMGMIGREAVVNGDGCGRKFGGGAGLVLLQGNHAQEVQGVRVIWLDSQDLAIKLGSLIELAGLMQAHRFGEQDTII